MQNRLYFLGLCLLLAVCKMPGSTSGHYVGPEACALCHMEIAQTQKQTAMANTWQGGSTAWLPSKFVATVTEDLPYEIRRSGASFLYSVDAPNGRKLSLPIDILMGGRRHGIGFLASMNELDGIPLARPALIQARYAWSPEQKKLLLAPGCQFNKPQSLEPALGLVLSPTFEQRCLSCHGQPNLRASGKAGGVHCESCHGPGSEHLAAIGRGTPRLGIVNPKHLSNEDGIAVCAQCHVGLARFSDPSGDDLLVANQVLAIRNSECFLQSGKAFSCTTCHPPHSDAGDNRQAVAACVGCHTASQKKHAAICPVNATTGCIGCHMPSVELGPLHLVDHLIRVHPEQKIQVPAHNADLATRITPISEYLRLITVTSAESAESALTRIGQREPFYQVAREVSTNRYAAIGGYLGRKNLAAMDAKLASAAALLSYGETSPVIQSNEGWLILQRLPRDFRWTAEQEQQRAEQLAASGNALGAIEKAQAALSIYPQFLRALNFIGVTFAQSGDLKKGAEVFTTATRLYPEDAQSELALAGSLTALNDRERARQAYKKVIAIEPDFTIAYLNLGRNYDEAGDFRGAIATFRQGLQIDPLSAELYNALSSALSRSGDQLAGDQARRLASKIDPALQ